MRTAVFALAAWLLLPVGTLAAESHGALAAARQRVESADYRLSGHLVRVDAKGVRTSEAINIKARGGPGMLRVLFEVASPAAARVHVLIEMRPGNKSTIQIAHPGDTAASTLPFDRWSEGPLGAGFSYEDLADASFLWTGQADQGEAKFGARQCDLVKSTPGAEDRTHYAFVKSWLDQGSGFPVYVEKTLKSSGGVKEFTYFGLRQAEGVWSASQVEVKMRAQAGSMLLVIDRGTAKAHLGMNDFSSAQLTHF